MITNCQEVAKYAIACGVDRIFIDLEIIGKHSRQGHLSTVISDHSISDIKRLRSVVPSDCLMVRINPIHQNSLEEIENVIDAGADMIMLPMYKKLSEVELFARAGFWHSKLVGPDRSERHCRGVPVRTGRLLDACRGRACGGQHVRGVRGTQGAVRRV